MAFVRDADGVIVCEMCYLRAATRIVGSVPVCETCIIEQDIDPRYLSIINRTVPASA